MSETFEANYFSKATNNVTRIRFLLMMSRIAEMPDWLREEYRQAYSTDYFSLTTDQSIDILQYKFNAEMDHFCFKMDNAYPFGDGENIVPDSKSKSDPSSASGSDPSSESKAESSSESKAESSSESKAESSSESKAESSSESKAESSSESKDESSSESKDESSSDSESKELAKDQPKMILPQFVIKTPMFPYVHDPVNFDMARIEEIDASGMPVDPKQPLEHFWGLCYIHSSCNGDNNTFLPPEMCNEPNSTGEVLGCVENQEGFKSGTPRVPCSPKNIVSDENSNLENLENVHRPLLCMQYAAQLKVKKKSRRKEPYICNLCGATFTAKSTLMQHYHSRANHKRFGCDLCGARFTRHSSLSYHTSVHYNHTPFSCPFGDCRRGFRHPHHYKNHLKDHEGPHQCIYCDSGLLFKTVTTYKRHLKLQHGKHYTSRGIVDIHPTN